MASITVWIFDSKAEAQAHAEANGNDFIGPTKLGSVDVFQRSGNSSTDKYYADYEGKWGVAIIG